MPEVRDETSNDNREGNEVQPVRAVSLINAKKGVSGAVGEKRSETLHRGITQTVAHKSRSKANSN